MKVKGIVERFKVVPIIILSVTEVFKNTTTPFEQKEGSWYPSILNNTDESDIILSIKRRRKNVHMVVIVDDVAVICHTSTVRRTSHKNENESYLARLKPFLEKSCKQNLVMVWGTVRYNKKIKLGIFEKDGMNKRYSKYTSKGFIKAAYEDPLMAFIQKHDNKYLLLGGNTPLIQVK
ncbi:unnamed protein product [Cunninghamella echinulata]